MDIGGTDSYRILVRLVGSHSPGAPLVGLADQKGRPPRRRYGPFSPLGPSDLFGPHLCHVRNCLGEGNILRVIWGRCFDRGAPPGLRFSSRPLGPFVASFPVLDPPICLTPPATSTAISLCILLDSSGGPTRPISRSVSSFFAWPVQSP